MIMKILLSRFKRTKNIKMENVQTHYDKILNTVNDELKTELLHKELKVKKRLGLGDNNL
jgi:hypothetical protein